MTLAAEIPIAGPLAGGALIGLSVVLLLLLGGSVAGISGIFGNTLKLDTGPSAWRPLFVLGLLLGIPLVTILTGKTPEYLLEAELPLLLLAGLLVGIGTRLGNGCTSGHGVCGIANLSPRSLVATLTFMGTAGLVVFLLRHGAL